MGMPPDPHLAAWVMPRVASPLGYWIWYIRPQAGVSPELPCLKEHAPSRPQTPMVYLSAVSRQALL